MWLHSTPNDWTNFRKHYPWMRPAKFQHFTPPPPWLWIYLILHCVPTLAEEFNFENVFFITLELLRNACFRDINTPNAFYLFAITSLKACTIKYCWLPFVRKHLTKSTITSWLLQNYLEIFKIICNWHGIYVWLYWRFNFLVLFYFS